jgi:chlorobactene glucosyltransferase
VRRFGDGNPGRASAWRAGGWRLGFPALLLDYLKGALPVGLAHYVAGLSSWMLVPLSLAHRWRWPVLSAAIGQYMLFRREAYDQVGGHAAVRQHAADDLALGRQVKGHGLRFRLVDGEQRVSCRMYHNAREVHEGLSKNLLAAFGYIVPAFLFVWLWLGFVFWQPLVILGLSGLGVDITPESILLAIAAVAASLLLWGLTYWRFGFDLWLVPLYPLSVLAAVWLALRSLWLTVRGQATWKGRTLAAGSRGTGE